MRKHSRTGSSAREVVEAALAHTVRNQVEAPIDAAICSSTVGGSWTTGPATWLVRVRSPRKSDRSVDAPRHRRRSWAFPSEMPLDGSDRLLRPARFCMLSLGGSCSRKFSNSMHRDGADQPPTSLTTAVWH